MKKSGWIVVVFFALFFSKAVAAPELFTETERVFFNSHGPWTIDNTSDPSNIYSAKSSAIEFGRELFFDVRLSRYNNVSCASCHIPNNAFSDGRPTAVGAKLLDRNTIALANLKQQHWYGWAGQTDTLWGQSIRPLLNPKEMDMSTEILVARIRNNADLGISYKNIFGQSASLHDEQTVLVNIAKALAAFQETITTPPTSFDNFYQAVKNGDQQGVRAYPQQALSGLKIFLGKGRCSFCHFGPNFTNGEFHNIGISHFTATGDVDPGRTAGLAHYFDYPFNRNGRYSDEGKASAELAPGNFVKLQHGNWGEFRVPSLRNVANTGPYMHNGSITTLREVVEYYSTINLDRLHGKGETLLRPLPLSESEIDSLIAFLHTLSNP